MVRRAWVAGYDEGERSPKVSDAVAGLVLRHLEPVSSAICADTTDKVMALTFDDGPDEARTLATVEVLEEHGARGTFFMLAEAAERQPSVVARVLDGGHEIGLHGVDHTRVTGYDVQSFRAVLADGKHRLEQVAGRPVQLYRPAYGAFLREQVTVVKELGLEPVIWSAWAQDWQDDPVAEVTERALRAAHPGAIMLLHDFVADQDLTGRDHDCAAWTRGLIEGLGTGWSYPTVSDLLDTYPQHRCPWFDGPTFSLRSA